MRWLGASPASATFVDTKQGIFTDSQIWFRTREAWLNEYAGKVFDRKPLELLLGETAVWVRSPQTLALWLLPLLLIATGSTQALLTSFIVFVTWSILGPALVNRPMTPALRFLEVVIIQALVYVGVLSWLASSNDYIGTILSLAWFVGLRWGLVEWMFRPLFKRLHALLYRIPVPDTILRTLIIRAALHYRITLADFALIEQRIIGHLRKK